MASQGDRRVVVTAEGGAILVTIYQDDQRLAVAEVTPNRALDLAIDLLAPQRRQPRVTHALDATCHN